MNHSSQYGAACVATAIAVLLAGPAQSQTVLTGNQATIEITDRSGFSSYKTTLKSLSDIGNRGFWSDGPSESNNQGVDYLCREMEAVGYTSTVYGDYRSVFCTKVGTVSPDSMYMVSAHLDGVGGEGSGMDDNGSGTALVLEVARAFADPRITTRYSIRFFAFNQHEGGWKGSDEYLRTRGDLQGREDPSGSGLYPEPVWRALINQDMILWDHGLPWGPEQSPDADIDVHFSDYGYPQESQQLAEQIVAVDNVISVDYPAETSPNLFGCDAVVFLGACPCVDLRENDRVLEIGEGSNPHHHAGTDRFETYSDADFALGYSAVRRVTAVLAQLTEATVTLDGTSVRRPGAKGLTAVAAPTGHIELYDASGRALGLRGRTLPARGAGIVRAPGGNSVCVGAGNEGTR